MESLKEKLRKNSVKLTKPRLAVLEKLLKSKRVLSARQLHEAIGDFDQASIYRALKLFESKNLVNVEIVNKEKLYCAGKEPHHHIICSCCGYIDSLPCNETQYKHRKFTKIKHHLTLRGLCDKCSNKK